MKLNKTNKIETFLCYTFARNIALGENEIEIDTGKLLRAIELASLNTVVDALPDGLSTVIGERGTRLSGGQRQRIGIARALYKDPDIIVMDEATSALDSETEKYINLAIKSLTGDKTVIVIAHRLSTVRHCDQIILMEEGSIRSAGTFEELAKTDPEFHKMIELSKPSFSS